MSGRVIKVDKCDSNCPYYYYNNGGHMEDWISCKITHKEIKPWKCNP